MTVTELKVMQMAGQHLFTPADKMTVVRDLCGIQAQFLVHALHALKIRCRDYDAAHVADGLVKNWTIRGTVHIFAKDDLSLFLHCRNGEDYLRNDWKSASFWNQRDSWALTPERQRYLTDVILAALEKRPCTREELKEICRAQGMTSAEESSMFEPWGGGIRELCERGFMHYTVQEQKAFCLSPRFVPIPEKEAKLEMARRYFAHYGPATVHDAAYFFGCRQAEVRTWLTQLPVTAFVCDGKTYYSIDSGSDYSAGIPDCVFLAGFDPLMLGYQKNESLYLPKEHLRGIFSLAGIVMPAVLLHGTVVGRWKKDGKKVRITPFVFLSANDRCIIGNSACTLWPELKEIAYL